MAPAPAAPRAELAARTDLRWTFLVGLLAGEALLLSLVADFPLEGPAQAVAASLRVLFPVALAAVVAGVLMTRTGTGGPRVAVQAPPWRPFPAIAWHALAFAVTAAFAHHLMGPGRPPPGIGLFLAWLGCALGSFLLGLGTVAPPAWLVRWLVARWRAPLLAVALGGLVWLAAWGAEQLWGSLSAMTLRAVAALLLWSGWVPGLRVEGVIIGTQDFAVEIAPVCSGADGIGLVFTFLAVWIALARERLRMGRALLLLPLGVAAAAAANVLRVAALVALGCAGHGDLAVGGFHSKLGWLLFAAIALGLVAVAERVPWIRRPEAAPGVERVAPERGPDRVLWIAPLLAALAVGLLTGLFADGAFDAAYVARIGAAALVLLAIRRELPSLRPGAPLVSILAGVGLAAIWIVGSGGGVAPVPAGLAELPGPWRVAWIAGRVAGGVVIVPWIEELAFRGFLLEWMGEGRTAGAPVRRWPVWALLASSLAFAAIHGQLLLAVLAGLVFGALRLWRGRVGDAVLAHAACNLALALAVLAGGRWALW
jgi:exosortase E/protease (VPEID-CTERM system)